MRTRSAEASAPATSSVPRLPPEVIARIQGWAEVGQSPAERLKLRARFELVNKEWYSIVDYLTHIVIAKLSDLTKLTTKLRSSRLRAMLGSKTKSVTIAGQGWTVADRGKAYSLLKWVGGVESVDFAEWTGAEPLDRAHSSGLPFTELLATFTNLRRFTIGHTHYNPSSIQWLVSIEYLLASRAGADQGLA